MPKKIEKTTRQTRSSANKNKSSQATRTKTTVVAPTETRSSRSRSTTRTNASVGKSKKAVDHKSMTVSELKKEYESRFGKYTGYKPKQELLDALTGSSRSQTAPQKTKPAQKPKEKLSQKQPAKKPLSQKAAKQQEQMFEHFVSQDFDIDELVDKVKIPASWKWVGEQGKNIDWMYHLVETDEAKKHIVCLRKAKKYDEHVIKVGIDVYSDSNGNGKVTKSNLKVGGGIDKLLHEIETCKNRLVAIPMYIKVYVNSVAIGHANMIVIDKDANTKSVERFEPQGEFELDMVHEEVDNLLREELVHKYLRGYKYIHPLDYCPKVGPQVQADNEKNSYFVETEGFCQAFSLLYFHLRVVHPDWSQRDIVKRITQGGGARTHERIVKYARLIDSKLK